jgi:hypothetical protein
VADAHRLIVRKVDLQAAGDLLRAPGICPSPVLPRAVPTALPGSPLGREQEPRPEPRRHPPVVPPDKFARPHSAQVLPALGAEQSARRATGLLSRDIRGRHFGWRRCADALRRISLAWRSSRTSRSRALMRSRSSLVEPARSPWSRSAWRTQPRNVSPVQPLKVQSLPANPVHRLSFGSSGGLLGLHEFLRRLRTAEEHETAELKRRTLHDLAGAKESCEKWRAVTAQAVRTRATATVWARCLRWGNSERPDDKQIGWPTRHRTPGRESHQ